MARMIDADEFKREISAMAIKNNYPVSKVCALCEIIDSQPTVDAEPVRHGKWIDNNAGNHDPRDRWVKCSLCGYSTTDRFSKEYKYCPNCGAKMEEESDNG